MGNCVACKAPLIYYEREDRPACCNAKCVLSPLHVYTRKDVLR